MPGEWSRATFQYDPVGQGHTFDFILDKLESFLLQTGWERPSWDTGLLVQSLTPGNANESRYFIRTDRNTQDRWRYTGDAVTQHGGIVISYQANSTGAGVETGPQIVIQTFLQNTAASGVQISTQDVISGSGSNFRFGSIRLSIDNTTINSYLVYGGEDGLYLESGANGLPTNLGHGAIMTFGAIPEFHGTRDIAVQWTAQGLVLDFTRNCKFTVDRNDRFVTNDGTNKNFTASLQPQTPRGTASIFSTAGTIENQRAYYVGAQDNFLSMGVGGSAATTAVDVASSATQSMLHAASFGLINTPLDGRFRISPLVMRQHLAHVQVGVSSSSASNNVAPSSSALNLLDARHLRRVFRFGAVDYTLLPYVNIVDVVSGATYRVLRIDDNGRFSQLGVEVPLTPPLVL